MGLNARGAEAGAGRARFGQLIKGVRSFCIAIAMFKQTDLEQMPCP